MKQVENSERYIQIFTFQFVLDKDLNSFLVDILPNINMNSMGQVDDVIREGVINGMLDLVEPQIHKIRAQMLAIPSLMLNYGKPTPKTLPLKKFNSSGKSIRMVGGKISVPQSVTK